MSKKRIIRKAGLGLLFYVYHSNVQQFGVWLTTCGFNFLVKPNDRGKKDALENLKREIAILKKVDHPNIVKLYEVKIKQGRMKFSLQK